MPTLAETLAAGADELGEFNALFQQYLDALATLSLGAVYFTFWVDTVTGDNTNDGLTPGTPLQTIGAAVAKARPGSHVVIYLLSNYTMDADISASGRVVRILGLNASSVLTQRNFIQTQLAGTARKLVCDNGGAFFLSNLDIYLTKSVVSSGSPALCQGVMKKLFMNACGVDVETGVTTGRIMASNGISILETSAITALDDTIAGHWIEGVAAATNPNTLGKVVTNLATL